MRKGTPLSDKMKARMKSYNEGFRYRLAIECGLSPSTYSSWMLGIYSPPFGDKRAVALGRRLGLTPDQVFTPKTEKTTTPTTAA